MTWLVWLNTVICILGTAAGVMVASGSVISIANMQVSWAWLLMVAAFLIPVMFVIGGVSGWIAYAFEAKSWLIACIVLPWAYLAAFVAAMLATFAVL